MHTLTPHLTRYLQGRVRRGEITARTGVDMRYRLLGLAKSHGMRPVEQLGPKAIDRWLEMIGEKAPATRREYLSTVRGFCRYLQAEGLIRRDPTAHVPAIHQPRRSPVTLTAGEVARLLSVAPDARGLAVLWLMVGCGCRCVEVARLRIEDYDPRGRTIRLVGKARHERVIAVPVEVARAVDAYLDERGRVAGALIENRVYGGHLSNRTLGIMVRDWMKRAGIKARALDGRSAHGLRRTAASDVMDQSGDLRAVQEMLGHLSIETTAQHYLRPVSMVQLREAMEGRAYDVVDDDDYVRLAA